MGYIYTNRFCTQRKFEIPHILYPMCTYIILKYIILHNFLDCL